jgi:cell division protein ZapB
MKLSGNKLLPLLASFTVLFVLAVVLYVNDQKKSPGKGALAQLESVNGTNVAPLDGDLPEHTLNKLTTDIAQYNDQLKGTTELVEESVEEFRQLKREIEVLKSRDKQLTKELEAEKRRNRRAALTGESGVNTADVVKQVMDKLNFGSDSSSNGRQARYPVNTASRSAQGSGSTQRIHGLGIASNEPSPVSDLLPDFMKKPDLGQDQLIAGPRSKAAEKPPTPVYTIPDLSILNDATAVTHLIGRVPIKGDVTDPAPFKIVLGHDNLAANGHHIPGIEGMFMEGHVWGDATLSCVRANVERASFVFKDGTIVSFPEKKNNSKRSNKAAGSGTIGYLTDAYGSTCIPGRYITNAPRTLSAQFLADLSAGAAEAYANKESTSIVTSSGDVTTAVTGDDGKYVLGQAVASGTQGVSDYIRSRNLDIWDSILVRSGLKVAVHLQTEIPIDYAKHGRRISYFSKSAHGMTD